MESDTNHTTTSSQGNQPRSQEEETQPVQSAQTIHKKNRHYRKPTKPKFIITLSQHKLDQYEISLLSKGLNFIPTPKPDHPAKILQDLLLFDRKLRLKYHFHQDTPTTQQDSNISIENDIPRTSILTTQDEITSMKSKYKKNLKKQEITALRNLQQNQEILIKPAD